MPLSIISTPCKVSNTSPESYLSPPRYERKQQSMLPSSSCKKINFSINNILTLTPPRSHKKVIMNNTPMGNDNNNDPFEHLNKKIGCYSTIKKKAKSISPVRILHTIDNRKNRNKVKPIYLESSGLSKDNQNKREGVNSFENMLLKCCDQSRSNNDYDKRRNNSYETMKNINKINPKYDLESYMLNRAITQQSQTTKTPAKKTPASKAKSQSRMKNSALKTKLSIVPSYINKQRDNFQHMLRTSELEPSLFQLTIPSFYDLYTHLRLCNYVYNKTTKTKNDSINDLVEKDDDFHIVDNSTFKSATSSAENKIKLEEIICAKHGMYEVHIFNNANENCIIVCYQAMKPSQSHQQSKTNNNIIIKNDIKEMTNNQIYPPYYNAYFSMQEKEIFTKINNIKNASNNLFADVVFVGACSNYNASIATIASIRYATYHHSTRVCCHVYDNKPNRIGTNEFKYYAHSLPNLNIVCLNYLSNTTSTSSSSSLSSSSRQYDNNMHGYQYVGHLITIFPSSNTNNNNDIPQVARAYKFHKDYQQQQSLQNNNHNTTTTTSSLFFKSPFKSPFKTPKKKSKRKIINASKMHNSNIKACLQALEVLHKNNTVIKHFAGEDYGNGVSGLHNESRLIV